MKGNPDNLTQRWRICCDHADNCVGHSEMMVLYDRIDRSILQGHKLRYKLTQRYGLSLVNMPILHPSPFTWDVAILEFDERGEYELCFSTPLADDVIVFRSDEETNHFIFQAKIVLTLLEIYNELRDTES